MFQINVFWEFFLLLVIINEKKSLPTYLDDLGIYDYSGLKSTGLNKVFQVEFFLKLINVGLHVYSVHYGVR